MTGAPEAADRDPRPDPLLVGLDLGTTNVKALVTDLAGRPLAQGAVPVRLVHGEDGRVEQDLEEIWRATLAALQHALGGVDASKVAALGVSSQGGAMQVVDACQQPLGPVVSWLDDRGHAEDDAFTNQLGSAWFAGHIGHGRAGLAIGQVLRLRRAAPGGLTPPNRIGFVGDLIVGRLGGHGAHDATSAGLTLLFNPSLRAYDPELLDRLGVTSEQLPPLLSPRAPAGGLLPEVAAATGLRAGIPVSAAVHDQYAAALGTGTVSPGAVMFGAGTAWVLLAVADRLAPPVIPEAFVCCHVCDGLYGQLLSLRNGGSAVSWALRLVARENLAGEELDTLLVSARPGCDGLRCWPFLAAYGAAGVGQSAKGCLSGLQLFHTPAQVVRAVVEGLACELGRHLRFLREARLPAERLVMCGGAAASRITPQIIADVTGLPVACQTGGAGSLLGAAVLARGLLEPERPLGVLATEMVPAWRQVTPRENAPLYAGLFREYLASLTNR